MPGHLMRMEGRLAFLPCGEGPSAIWIVESAGAGSQAATAWSELGGGNRPVPAMVRLSGDTIEEVRHVMPEGGRCDHLRGAGEWNAHGNEPFWHLRVDGRRAVFTTPDSPDGTEYLLGRWVDSGDSASTFLAVRGIDTLALELHAGRCTDGMSGAWYPYRAMVRLGERRLTGCGLEGVGAPTSRQ